METFDLYTSVRILDGKPWDYRVGPWESVADAEGNIPLEERYKGLTVIINDRGSAVDHHFKNGIQNGFLIPKIPGNLILPDMILSGGDTSADEATGLVIAVSPVSWLITMITYQIVGETVLNLQARDANFSRMDVIIATASGLSVVTGEADASVLDPNLPDGSVVVRKILVTPAETVVSTPEPITASNLIPAFQARRNYAKDEPIQVPGVGIYTANAKFKSGNTFVGGNWTLRASLGGASSFADLTGDPLGNTALANILNSKPTMIDNKIQSANLPSYVDDVLEYSNFASLPASGETGKIYITLDDNSQYRWSGTVYVKIVSSPGSSDAVPEGVSNLYFTVARVLATILTGIGFSDASSVLATDTILQAFGKLQARTADLFIKIGTLTSLTTTDKTSLVNAINEVNAKPSGGGSVNLDEYLTRDGSKVYATTTGINTYVASLTPALTAYTAGEVIFLKIGSANTGASTINLGPGAKAITKNGTSPVLANDLPAGQIIALAYDGTQFQLLGSLNTLPTVTSGEKVLSVTSAGVQKNYDTAEQIVSATALTSASWTTGIASVTGLQGQVSYDTNYKYDCIAVDQWRRSALNGELVELYLSDVNDSAGARTSAQLETAYPTSKVGQRVFGSLYLYEKKTSSGWIKTSISIA